MEIKSKKGNVIGKIDFQSRQDIISEIIDLRPGEGKAIYIADAADNKFSQQTNCAAISWDGSLESLKEKLTPWQPQFPTHSVMCGIQVYYGFENLTSQEIDEMVEESERTGKNVVVRELKPNNKLVGVSITYENNQETYKFQIFGTTKSRIQMPDGGDSSIEQLNVRDIEAFYISNAENQQLIWIEEDINGKALQYEISGRNIQKEDALSVMESME